MCGVGIARTLATLAVIAITAALLAPTPARASSPDIVISEVYFGGGNADSRYDANFVELFNRGSAPVSLTGWTLQSRRITGDWSSTPLYGAIQAGGYYLIQVGLVGEGANALGPPDVETSLIGGAVTIGAVAVVAEQTVLSCGAAPNDCATITTLRDLVGWGATTAVEGSSATPADAATSLTRVPAGARGFPSRNSACHDDDNNSTEFRALPPTPRSSLGPAAPCPPPDVAPTVVETIPANGSTGVAIGQPLSIRFSEPVSAPRLTVTCSGGQIDLRLRSDDYVTFTATHRQFRYGDACTLVVAAGSARDNDPDDPPDGLATDVVVSFTTVPPTTFATLRTTSAPLLPGGWLSLNVRCSPQAMNTCTGNVVLTIPDPAATKGHPPRRVTIGTGTFVIGYRRQARVGVRLNKTGKRALAARGRLLTTATVTSTDAAGRTLTSESPLVVQPERPKPSR